MSSISIATMPIIRVTNIINFFTFYYKNNITYNNLCKIIFSFLKESKFRSAFTAVLFAALATMGIIYYHIFIIVKKHQATRLLYKQSGTVHSNKPNQVQTLSNSFVCTILIVKINF